MLEHQHQFRLKPMAAVLGVTRSGYYAWRKSSKEPSARLLKQHSRDEQIKAFLSRAKSAQALGVFKPTSRRMGNALI
jgi:transcriptional regulator with XRE-family HTH domain